MPALSVYCRRTRVPARRLPAYAPPLLPTYPLTTSPRTPASAPRYYAYYSIYGDDGDEEDIYDTYYESYLDPYAEAPDALDMLASLAELIAWSSHTGSLVLHLFPIGGIVNGGRSASVVAPQLQEPQQLSPAQLQLMQLQRLREQSDAAEVAQGRGALLFAGQPYDPAAATASADPFMLLLNGEEGESASAGTLIISDLNLAWFNDDGSLNWGLVTLLILTAGTLAMLVGFVVSWLSLRRTMRTAVVYPGGAAAWRRAGARRVCAAKAGAGSEGGECDSLDNPLLLLPEVRQALRGVLGLWEAAWMGLVCGWMGMPLSECLPTPAVLGTLRYLAQKQLHLRHRCCNCYLLCRRTAMVLSR